MRPPELVGFLLAIVPLAALVGLLPVQAGIAGAVLCCGILLASAVRLGAYWQIVPLYIGSLLALTALLLLAHAPRWTRSFTAAACACLLFLSATFTYALPMFRLPRPAGPYAVGTRIIHLVDPQRMETHVSGPARSREIMVQFWYPASPNGQHLASYRTRRETTWLSSYMGVLWTHSYVNAPVVANGDRFPVLLLNPAWKGQRTQNTYQTEDLASHGFIVAAIDHTYNSGPVAFPNGRVVTTANIHDITHFEHTTLAQQIAIGDREVRIQAGDDVLTLDYLARADLTPGSPWFGRVDANTAGAFGHSFGGAVSAQACYQDPRIKAALNEDGWIFGDVATEGLRKPYMVMHEDEAEPSAAELESHDVQTRREAELDRVDLENLNRTMRDHGGYFLKIDGSRHNNFRDRSLYSPICRLTECGTISPVRAHRIIEAYTLQFFSQTLLNRPAPLLAENNSPYKEVHFENWFDQNALKQ